MGVRDRGTNMRNDDTIYRGKGRREAATRRAFYIWMAAYAAVLVAIVAIHSFGGIATGTTIDANGVRTQQAGTIGAPQSSLAVRLAPVSFDREG